MLLLTYDKSQRTTPNCRNRMVKKKCVCVSGHEYVIEVSMPYTLTAYHQGFPGVVKTQHGKQCIEVVTENYNSIRYNLERKYMHATVLKFI